MGSTFQACEYSILLQKLKSASREYIRKGSSESVRPYKSWFESDKYLGTSVRRGIQMGDSGHASKSQFQASGKARMKT